MTPHSIALVDLGYLFTRNYRGAGIGAPPNAGAERTLTDLSGIDADVDLMVVCLDAPPYRRRDRFEAYKAQREEPPPEEVAQKRAVIEEIKRRGYITAKVKGYEADDLIATLATKYSEWCTDVRIVASDKDVAQLITDRVVQFVPPSGERQTEKRDAAACHAKFGVWPNQMRLWQALCGDSSDNIPGVPGVGPKKAALIILDLVAAGYTPTLEGLESFLVAAVRPGAMWKSIKDHWQDLSLSYELVTLDRSVPIDADELLRDSRRYNTEVPPPPDDDAEIRPDPVTTDEPPAETTTRAVANDTAPQTPRSEPPPKPAPKVVTDAQFDPIGPSPGANGPLPPKPAAPTALAPRPAKEVIETEYGLVTTDLQPRDLRAARTISTWIAKSNLYKAFTTPEQVFAVILRGKELGLGVTTALAGFHVIEGKPSASADLIRSLAERDPDCEYFMLVESSPTQATWETKHRRHPRATSFTYTIEEAKLIPEYWRKDRWGGPSQWEKRPRDMLTKTAASKLARLVYAGACLGLYCPEELGVLDTVGEAA